MPREDDPDVVRVLVSTDNHLGYLEKDPIRGEDSFRAFEEVLAIAKANGVDMLLLGGDLFHDNKPTRRTLVRTMTLLRRQCLGDDPIRLAVRSDPDQVNYMDSSYAVSLPVFVIHGNHDDATGAAGADALSALDILAQANLVTYFGKAPDSRRITVSPILLQKGRTKLALYGLGNVRDDVLYETWVNAKQVHWLKPKDDVSDDEHDEQGVNWFSMFVIHQNRAFRGTAKAIADTVLPMWLDYVVWGHEHDSIPELTKTLPPIVQPGSSVATSLSHGEALPKHAVLLEIKRGKMRHRPVPLHTVRDFRFEDVALGDKDHDLTAGDAKGVEAFLNNRLEDTLADMEADFDEKKAAFERDGGPPPVSGVKYPGNDFYLPRMSKSARQPLIRLRVEYSGGFDTMNPQRVGQAFVGRVANPMDTLLFYRKRKSNLRPFMRGHTGIGARDGGGGGEDGDDDGVPDFVDAQPGDGRDGEPGYNIPGLVEYFLYHKGAGGAGLKFLELDKLSVAVDDFVCKSENRAIPDYVASYLKMQQDKTLDAQERRGAVLTDVELSEGFKSAAEKAAMRVLATQAREKELAEGGESPERDGGADEDAGSGDDDERQSRGRGRSRDRRMDVGDEGDATGGDKSPPSEKAGPRDEDVPGTAAIASRFEAVQTMLSRNPLTAGVTTAAKRAAEDASAAPAPFDDDDDEDEDDYAAAKPKPRAKAGRGRGSRGGRTAARKPPAARGRGLGSRASSRASSRRPALASIALDDDDDDGAARAPPKRARQPPRRAAVAAAQSYAVDDDDDDDDDDDAAGRGRPHVIALDLDEEIQAYSADEEPAARGRKRKAPAASPAPGSRPRSRARTARAPRARRATDTIDLGDSDD